MIKIGDLVAVEGQFGHFLGIVIDKLEGGVWEWTIAECETGDYVPCSEEELKVISSPSQIKNWERKIKINKMHDKNK